MATVKQKRVARLIIENTKLAQPLTGAQMLAKVSYSKGIQTQPSRVLESEGVQEELKAQGFTEENAMNVVTEIMLNGDVDPGARLKATDQVFKVRGTYAPEKKLNLNFEVNSEHKERAINAIRNLRS